MNDEIKVGDVCDVIDACCQFARSQLIGVEVNLGTPGFLVSSTWNVSA